MKKILFILIIILSIFLFGCTENQDADYECEIKIDNWNDNCSALKGRAHACQITDPNYDIESGVPNFCNNYCVNRSGFLSQVSEECFIITVQDSRFKSEGVPTVYWEQKYELTEEPENTTNQENNLEDNTSQENIVEEIVQGNCQFDSDCKDTCVGTKIVDYYCDLKEYTCEIAKETDCAQEKEIIIGKEYSKICSNLNCVISKTELEDYKKEISDIWKQHNDLRQELTKLEFLMDDIMLKQAEGITQELMIKTFNSLNTISGNWIQLIADITINTIDDGLAALARGDTTNMDKGETFAWAYNNREKIREETRIIDEKLLILSNMTKELTQKISELE
jgi:hypothetical protein